jgi:NAD(P)-dependent dehydrogenase (short-subunit alcohol dehydrogenase family)
MTMMTLLDTTSKGAVLAMTRELAMIHAREGIRFNSLCPSVTCLLDRLSIFNSNLLILMRCVFSCHQTRSGPLKTPLLMDFLNTPEKLNRRLNHLPMGRFGEAIEQAKAVLFREFLDTTSRP